MFGKKKASKISSTSKEAKKLIRAEIQHYYSPARKGGGKSALDNMQQAANSYSEGKGKSDWGKGAALVDAGCFAVWEQVDLLGKIYGKEEVQNWDYDKRHNTYRSLIGREYAAMLEERKKDNQKRLEAKIKSDMLKAKKDRIAVIKPGTETETDDGVLHLVIGETGKYTVLLQPYEEWKGKRIPSDKGWRTVKSGSLRECSAAINKASGQKNGKK